MPSADKICPKSVKADRYVSQFPATGRTGGECSKLRHEAVWDALGGAVGIE